MSKTVAVIGASSNRFKFGNKALRAFLSQGFTVFAINPNEKQVEGLTTYPSVLDVPGPIDMATLYVPGRHRSARDGGHREEGHPRGVAESRARMTTRSSSGRKRWG